MPEIPPIESLIPHRASMLLLDRVVEASQNATVAEYTPRADAWYADAQGDMPAWMGIEVMAQAVAAHVGLNSQRAGRSPREGALLGMRRYAASQPAFAQGAVLRARAQLVFQDPAGLAAYDCTLECGGAEVARAQLKVYEPEDFEAFRQGALA